MHKIEDADPIWQPMVVDSYIFPTVAHDALAFLGAQNQKMISYATSKHSFDQDSLTCGVVLLADTGSLEVEVRPLAMARQHCSGPHILSQVGLDPCAMAASYCFLQTIRTILFRSGRPQYGQGPPIGGVLLCDLVKAGAMVRCTMWCCLHRAYSLSLHRSFTKWIMRRLSHNLKLFVMNRVSWIFIMHFNSNGTQRTFHGSPSALLFLISSLLLIQRKQL